MDERTDEWTDEQTGDGVRGRGVAIAVGQ